MQIKQVIEPFKQVIKLQVSPRQLPHPIRHSLLKMGLFCFLVFMATAVPLQAQDETTPPTPYLTITSTETGNLPSISLTVYGMDGQGQPLEITPQTITVQQGGVPVGPVEVAGTHQAGTLTLFLIDIPTGVSEQFPAIQQLIEQFAAAPNMIEQVDAVGVYQVGETEARELLAPTIFYNSIRNLFSQSLSPTTGATALIDSIKGLLERANSLKQNPSQVVSLVVVTDGTDAVSSTPPGDVARLAADSGIPVHTIWLNNADLSDFSKEAGQTYLAEVAAGSRGLTAVLDNPQQITNLYNRILAFRDQTRLRYTVDGLTGGEFPVVISLTNQPDVQAETAVTIPANVPSVVINLPPEERAITLPDLANPVSLRLSATVTWLDGASRTVTAAQLKVNDTVVADIPVDNITEFTASIPNLVFGNNSLQVIILDDQGIRAGSPIISLNVLEGERQLPESLDVGGSSSFWLVVLLLMGFIILAGVGFILWRSGLLKQLPNLFPRGRREKGPTVTVSNAPPQDGGAYAYLEVLEATSRMPAQLPLTMAVVKIGRSPTQANIAFENDVTVSRLHASLMLEGDHYRIYDEGSTSGSYVNEQQVPEYGIQLLDGDEIHLGAVHLRFRQG